MASVGGTEPAPPDACLAQFVQLFRPPGESPLREESTTSSLARNDSAEDMRLRRGRTSETTLAVCTALAAAPAPGRRRDPARRTPAPSPAASASLWSKLAVEDACRHADGYGLTPPGAWTISRPSLVLSSHTHRSPFRTWCIISTDRMPRYGSRPVRHW